MATIQVYHLGPIHDVKIDIKKMNIFIGEQATGKSTLCKAIYFFREFKDVLLDYYYTVGQSGKTERGMIKELNIKMKDSFVKLFGYSWHLPDDLSMDYYYTDKNYIKLKLMKKNKKYISLEYSKNLREELNKLDIYAQQFFANFSKNSATEAGTFWNLEKKGLYSYMEHEISRVLDDDMATFYIPAGRELLTLLCNQKTYINYGELDPLNRKFMQSIEALQPKFSEGVGNVHSYFPKDERSFSHEKICSQIVQGMRGEYFYEKGKEFLKLDGVDERVEINFISSGQQEALWLYNQLYVLMLKNEKSFVIIEEPEAHLYPVLQKNILDFIVECVNIIGGAAIVTTHSPYILTEANNLNIVGRMKRKENLKKAVEKMVGRWIYIEPEKLNVYRLENSLDETSMESLVDCETGEIQATSIDEISDEINRVYTQLFYLEEGNMNDEG